MASVEVIDSAPVAEVTSPVEQSSTENVSQVAEKTEPEAVVAQESAATETAAPVLESKPVEEAPKEEEKAEEEGEEQEKKVEVVEEERPTSEDEPVSENKEVEVEDPAAGAAEESVTVEELKEQEKPSEVAGAEEASDEKAEVEKVGESESKVEEGEEKGNPMSEGLKRDYQVLEEIGRGRFGTVFRCFSSVSGEFYACKSIDKQLLADSLDRECLEKEAKIMQLVGGHQNVVQIFDVYEDEKHLDMVLELCDSSDLYDRVSKRIFSEAEAIAVFLPLMEAIAHCHRRGVAHRDIKPDNVLFDARNRVKLADFGSADYFHEGMLMKGIVGTPYYVAPEVLSGRDYNEKVDVWSAGVILYIMLAGIPPFYGESATDIFEAVLRGNLRFPSRIFHSVSPAAKDLLRKMLCKGCFKEILGRASFETSLGFLSGGESRSITDLT